MDLFYTSTVIMRLSGTIFFHILQSPLACGSLKIFTCLLKWCHDIKKNSQLHKVSTYEYDV